MAANLPFTAMGPSFNVTVAGTTPTTSNVTLAVGIGTTATVGYPATGIRIANMGAASAFLQFGGSAATVSANITTCINILANSVETFSCRGQPYISFASSGTTTVNVTPGEGI